MEFSAGLPATYPMPHVMHRLDVLRDVVMYHADDTPRSITTTQKPESGIGWPRCRDWGRSADFAARYTGCWRYSDAKRSDESKEIWRWTYCSEASP